MRHLGMAPPSSAGMRRLLFFVTTPALAILIDPGPVSGAAGPLVWGVTPSERSAREDCTNDVERCARPTAIVISGGVSLGSHQGGLLHYFSQFLGNHSAYLRDILKLGGTDEPMDGIQIATGASAGSINAFLSSMASCRAPGIEPKDSLYYRTWIPVGMEGLANRKGITSTSVLSRAPIDRSICRLRRLWDDKFKDGCEDIDLQQPLAGTWGAAACRGTLAFSVTRLEARDIALPFAS